LCFITKRLVLSSVSSLRSEQKEINLHRISCQYPFLPFCSFAKVIIFNNINPALRDMWKLAQNSFKLRVVPISLRIADKIYYIFWVLSVASYKEVPTSCPEQAWKFFSDDFLRCMRKRRFCVITLEQH